MFQCKMGIQFVVLISWQKFYLIIIIIITTIIIFYLIPFLIWWILLNCCKLYIKHILKSASCEIKTGSHPVQSRDALRWQSEENAHRRIVICLCSTNVKRGFCGLMFMSSCISSAITRSASFYAAGEAIKLWLYNFILDNFRAKKGDYCKNIYKYIL